MVLDRRKLVELLDMHANGTISWSEFAVTVQEIHKNRVGQPSCRKVMVNKPKEEDYFYANPYECLVNNSTRCDIDPSNSSSTLR